MGLFDPTTDPSAATSAGGFSSGLMSGGGGGIDVGDFFTAMGQSLLTSTRQNPFGNFAAALQQQDKRREDQTSRAALVAALVRSGMSLPDAQTFALNQTAAKIAIETQTAQKGLDASRKASAIMGGADTGDAGVSASPRAPGGPAAGTSLNGGALTPPTGTSAEIQNKFVGALKDGGLTNPNALGALAAYAQHESQYSPDNITGSWSDPSQKGQPGTSGGILSWRNERLDNMRAATAGAKDPVTAQAQFTLNENPELTAKLQAAKSPEEANALLAEAWKFAGYDKPGGGEYARRLATTQAYASRFGQRPTQVADATGTAPISPVTRSDVPPLPAGASGLNPNRAVQVANDENETQILEGRLGMLPSGTYGITKDARGQPATAPKVADAAADMPVANARPAEFQIPGAGATASPRGQEKAKALLDLSRVTRALMVPGLPDETRRALEGQRAEAQAILKPSDIEQKLAVSGLQPGSDEYQTAARRLAGVDRDDKDKLVSEYNQREQIADRLGLLPGSPERQRFTATGKFPGEEKPGLTAGDKQAIYKAEDAIPPLTSTLDTLKRAKELNPQTYTGMTAGALGVVGTKVPGAGYLIDEKKAANTREFNQIMSMEAIKAMSSTLKGATTDREMDRFVEILGDPSTPPAIRERTIDRMTVLAQRQLDLAQGRVNDLRGGTYFKPRDGAQPGQGGQPAQRGQGAAPAGGQAGQGQAPAVSFSADDLEAEARRRGLIQ